MAVPNMIVTLVANTTKWVTGLRGAANTAASWGARVGAIFRTASLAIFGVVVAIGRMALKFAEMGAESRKATIQLQVVANKMLGFGKTTQGVVTRLNAYADALSTATGLDDEQITAVQKKLLVFRALKEEIGLLGGSFDRATKAAIDLAAGGFGEAESNATKLGRMLENPLANLNALNRAGVTFSEQEKAKIARLVKSNELLKAQDVILSSVEGRFGGLAEKSATPLEKMNQQFQQIGDTIGEAMLPYLEDINNELKYWIASPEGKKDLQLIVQGFVAIAKAVADAATALAHWNESMAAANQKSNDFWSGVGGVQRQGQDQYAPYSAPSSARMGTKPSAVVVNFNTPVDSVSAGREISRVLSDFNRANGMR